MHREFRPPRESIIDLALLLETLLQEEGEDWYTGDQVMDLHRLKATLKERESRLDDVLSMVRLQGTAVIMTGPQKEALRHEAISLAAACLHILQAGGLLEIEVTEE